MKPKRTPGEILAIFIVLTITVVMQASPAFSSDCHASGDCPHPAIDRQQKLHISKIFQATPADCPSFFEERVILLFNVERANVGVDPLSLDIRLQAAARWMSDDMADQDYIPEDHVGSDGSTPAERIIREGYNYLITAENLAGGFPTPDNVVTAWMASQGHRDNILNPSLEHLGVGYTYQDMPVFDHYWTVDFAATDDPREAPLSSCDPGFYRQHFPIVMK
jgi:hypothetical protein